jgi:hypothetical protein
LGFFTFDDSGGGARLKTVNLATDAVETRSLLPNVASAFPPKGALNSSGDIIITAQEVFHFRPSGGARPPLAMRDLARGELFLSFPQFLPDGQHYLFTAFG